MAEGDLAKVAALFDSLLPRTECPPMTDPGYPQWERRYLDRKSATYVLAGAVRDLSDIAAIARGMADGS